MLACWTWLVVLLIFYVYPNQCDDNWMVPALGMEQNRMGDSACEFVHTAHYIYSKYVYMRLFFVGGSCVCVRVSNRDCEQQIYLTTNKEKKENTKKTSRNTRTASKSHIIYNLIGVLKIDRMNERSQKRRQQKGNTDKTNNDGNGGWKRTVSSSNSSGSSSLT